MDDLSTKNGNRRSADFRVFCIAGFQARKSSVFGGPADLEIGDTADLGPNLFLKKKMRESR